MATAKALAAKAHRVLLQGRNADKLERVATELGDAETYRADLSRIEEVRALAQAVRERYDRLDVLLNNASVYNAPDVRAADGLDRRFAVNTIVPYVHTRALLPIMEPDARNVKLSSAAQASVDLDALAGRRTLSAGQAYAKRKRALTM